jgi:mono/diheme cytochrome c family protein
MLKFLVLLPAALLFAFLPQEPAAPADQPAAQAAAPASAPADAAAPSDAGTKTNPVKPTAESQAHAKMMYGIDCAMCHAENGNGKGDLVADMHLSMKDLTDPDTLKSFSDGDLFALIKNGKGKMPGEGDRAKDEAIWNLVIYVRSLAKK